MLNKSLLVAKKEEGTLYFFANSRLITLRINVCKNQNIVNFTESILQRGVLYCIQSASDCCKAVVLVYFLLNVFGVGVSCRGLYSFVVYLYVNGSGSVTSFGIERANLSAVVYLSLCGFCLERFPLPLGAWDGLQYFIVALPGPSI